MNTNQASSRPCTDIISVGQRIHCILYGGKDGTVVEISGKQMPHTVSTIFGGAGVRGGAANFHIIWDDGTQSPVIPESLVRASVQWRVYSEVVSAEGIAKAWANVAIYKATAQALADEAKLAYQCEVAQAIKEYPCLHRVEQGQIGNGKFAAKNIRIELKAAWPSVKFSVKSDYDSVRLSWTDGPTQNQVESIVKKYNDGGFDSMHDIETSTPTAFTDLFGGARYLSYSRDFSDGLLSKALDALYQRLPENLATIERPSIEAINNGRTERIPNIDQITVGQVIRAIANAWDDVGKCYVLQNIYYSFRWITFTAQGESKCKPLV